MASESPAVIWEAIFAREREIVRALLKPVGAQSAEPSADAVAKEKLLVACMATVNPTVTREDVETLAFAAAVAELVGAVHLHVSVLTDCVDFVRWYAFRVRILADQHPNFNFLHTHASIQYTNREKLSRVRVSGRSKCAGKRHGMGLPVVKENTC